MAAEVTLLVREQCHTCADVRAVVERVCAEFGLPVTETDVDGERELRAEYGDRVPVVLIDGQEHASGTVAAADLRRALSDGIP